MALPKSATEIYVLKTNDLVIGDAPGVTLPNVVGKDNLPHKDLQENIDYLDGADTAHKTANPLDHPVGSVKKKHLDSSVDNTSIANLVNAGNADSLHTHLFDAGVSAQIRDSYRNLIIKNNALAPNSEVNLTCDEIIVQNDSGTSKKISNISEVLNIVSSGVNGLDTGAEAVSTWYHIWVIAKEDGTTDGLFSLSSTAPSMPSGYTYKALVGAIYNNSSSNFIKIYQRDTKVVIQTILATTFGPITLGATLVSNIIPTTAKYINGVNWMSNAPVGAQLSVYQYFLGEKIGLSGSVGADNSMNGVFYGTLALLNIDQKIWYDSSSISGGIYISGWEY